MNLGWFPVLVLAGLLTFATRLSFIALLGRVETPTALTRALRFVPPAVLSAIIFPALVMPSGAVDVSLRNPRLIAGLLAAGVALATRNVLATIAAGMIALWVLQAIG